ncbi:MAG: sulfotransferase family protein [Egibacteraceae bacterium]
MLEVIGAGFGRTGTLSLKTALERLGFGQCYHGIELMRHPEHLPLWEAAVAGEPDWAQLFAGYRACVDWPGVHFWRELVDAYPDAKVVLTVRDPRRWYASARNTFLPALESREEPRSSPPPGPPSRT